MFRNLFFAALVAALCAGLVTSVIQHFRVTPLIFAAESFEGEAGHHHHGEEAVAHSHAEGTPAHSHGEDEWMPQDGLERTGYTVLANILMAAGYALIIGAVSVLFNLPITWSTGLLWGLGGFAAFSLAPSFGLPPGLPGMPVADTFARQLWWAGTALSTGAALLLAAKLRAPWALAIAIALIVLPHVIGAPQAPAEATGVPAPLAASFAAAVLFNGAVFWVVLGAVFGRMHDYLATRSVALPAGATA
jgi:cobalt transporter subunit CbtA